MEKTINKIAVYFLTKEPKKILKKIKETKSLKNFGKQKAEKYYKEQKEYEMKIDDIIFDFFEEIDITDEDECEKEIIELSLKNFIEEKLNNGNLEIEDFYELCQNTRNARIEMNGIFFC